LCTGSSQHLPHIDWQTAEPPPAKGVTWEDKRWENHSPSKKLPLEQHFLEQVQGIKNVQVILQMYY